ncbi:MAG: trigger factor [Flavobacteriales bacterium]|nr:trigger factor [Flavobacteriales bacterium]
MEIVKEDIDKLNSVIKIQLKPADYEVSVSNVLKDYRLKANMPGFRKGKVPMSMINKMYGKSVLADELNKLLSNTLYKFIDENELKLLGSPLPNESNEKLDLDKETEFEFKYDIGLSPVFDVNISEKEKFTRYVIIIDEELTNKYVKDITKRFGGVADTDISDIDSMIQCDFQELDKSGAALEEGITNNASVSVEFVEDSKYQKKLIGLKVGDTLKVDPKKLSKGDADLAAMLGKTKAEVENLKSDFQITVSGIKKVNAAEINQELFDRVYGKDVIKTEKEFKGKINDELKVMFEKDSDFKLRKDVNDKLLSNLKLGIPDEFLKRWILNSNKKEITKEQLDLEYDGYAENLKVQLITSKIAKEKEIKIEAEEVTEYVKEATLKQYKENYGIELTEEQQAEVIKRFMENKEEVQNVYERLIDEKLMDLFKGTFNLKDKDISYDDFVKLVTEKKSDSFFKGLNPFK